MIEESRRRAYLAAMQVDHWLPRVTLPFAAPARPLWLAPDALEPSRPAPAAGTGSVAETPARSGSGSAPALTPVPAPPAHLPESLPEPRPRVEVPRPAANSLQAARLATPDSASDAVPVEPAAAKVATAPPRFALQLLRAGACVLLVELPTGEAFTRRDPGYLLLRDLLRAADLPDSPQLLGEPVRWPLLKGGSLDQGPQAALEYVQGFIAAQLEDAGECRCLWLVGLPALRFAGEADAEQFYRELQVDGLGAAWALPGLELLMDEPARKAELWRAMRRVMHRWKTVNE